MRQEYRFPRSAIVLMLLVLVGVVLAIEQARRIAVGDSSAIEGWSIVRVFAVAYASMFVTGAVGYGVLRLLRHNQTDSRQQR